MEMKLIWTEPAAEQLAERLEYIGAFNPDAASALLKRVEASLRRLQEFPELGRWVPEFGTGFYHEILVRPLRILYEDHGDSLAITYVHRQEEAIGPDTFNFDSNS